jgi:single-stranded-DNA-specific exonuclease
LDLVSIATVADMVPLLGENRSLVKYGLLVLNKTKREGLKSLINLTGLKFGKINERHLGFVIGPRINAAGRMQHARGAFDLLMAKDKNKAQELSLLLQEDNSLRQKTTEDYLNQAKVLLEDQIKDKKKILFLYKPEWNLGLVGLVAGKILEEYNRPVLIMSEVDGQIKGSGRSVKGFHITEALEQVKEFLNRYGGHAGACGFTLKDKKYLTSFQDKLIKIAENKIAEEKFVPTLYIDSLIKLKEVDWKLFEDLEKFSPYGQDVPVPRFLSEKLEVVNIEGVGLEQKHLRIFVKDEKGTLRKTIAFGFGNDWRDKIKLGDYLDLVYEVDVNEWNGNRELQLKVIDLKLR